jgi:DNA gyrase subunit B
MAKKDDYGVDKIQQLGALDQIRLRPGMYIGGSADPTKLLLECLDNAIDEVSAGFAKNIYVQIDNNSGEFIVADSGRGIPFDHKLPLYEDRPILICNSIFTSGKYKKNDEDSAYKVSSGLHGVGLTCVNALSEYMKINIFKNKKHARYEFKYKEEPVRHTLEKKSQNAFSTIITVKPHKNHFDTLKINTTIVKERLIITAANFDQVHIVLNVDGEKIAIKGSESNLIESYLGKNVKEWHEFTTENKNSEKCVVKIGWDFNSENTKMDVFTTVNFVKVEQGAHINKVKDIIEDLFQKLAKKNKFEFNSSDALNWLRIYINLQVVDVEFESQTKEKLSSKSNLLVMDAIPALMESYFKKLPNLNEILEKFEYYRTSMQNKKINKNANNTSKRSIPGFNKLRDCTKEGGELLIGEGESAIGGLLQMRDPTKHAILPLRGVVVNVTRKRLSEVLANDVVKDIITAIGCGITPHCNIDKLRYSKIILSADADPAGEFITALLITLFAKLTPELIQAKKLYVCKTPLFGYGLNAKFVPIWNQVELDKAREAGNNKIRRFKGLGQFNPPELKKITLDEAHRKLIPIEWDDVICKKLFDLMKDPKLKKDLVLDKYIY